MAKDASNTVVEFADQVEQLLEAPCWVIDLLPTQVPDESAGRFFAVEKLMLSGSNGARLRRQFADVLLKLYCYHDFTVFHGESTYGKANPSPAKLEKWVLRGEPLSILLQADDALIAVQPDCTCMAMYNPTPELLDQTRLLAQASGLFVWEA